VIAIPLFLFLYFLTGTLLGGERQIQQIGSAKNQNVSVSLRRQGYSWGGFAIFGGLYGDQ
jgi:hypothetical protein